MKKFEKAVVLDSVIFYPEHRELLNKLAKNVEEYPSSLPENLEKQYEDNPDMFKNVKCYTEIQANDTPKQLLMNRVEGADLIISCWTDIPDEVLKQNKNLKQIIFWTHEKEHRVNTELAEELGIDVRNIPDYGTDSVAEVVFAGLFHLLERNFYKDEKPSNGNISSPVMNEVFRRLRKLENNEKNSRRGRFLHHFHKLGKVNFNIDESNLDSVIPQKLVEGKNLGILGKKSKFGELEGVARNAFGMNVQREIFEDYDSSNFYKFISENDLIVVDSEDSEECLFEKIKLMAGDKMIDIKDLKSIDYKSSNKRFGIIGLGRIGEKVARTAKEMGFEVVHYSRSKKTKIEKEIGINEVSLNELLETSDVISLNVTAHHAYGLLDSKRLDKIKKGAIFINTSDGNSVNQEYLTKLMQENRFHTFLDVYPGLPRKDVMGMEMDGKKDWKIKNELDKHIIAYRAGWKTQESIRVKTYKLLGWMVDYLLKN